jgi:hypothetical protein
MRKSKNRCCGTFSAAGPTVNELNAAALSIIALKTCLCHPVGFPVVDVNATDNNEGVNPRRINYWRLWIFDAVLVSAGFLFYLATHYGTYEFFGKACAMALLPLIPVMVLVGGTGSTVFALTKVLIEKRAVKLPAALALLVGPALVVTGLLVLLGAGKSPGSRLGYICLGNAPASASQVQVAGYSTFRREEWLAVFHVGPKDFQTMVAKAELVPVDEFEFRKILEPSALKTTRLYQSLPPLNNALCYKRVFKEEEHKLGGIYAAFDPATSTAIVLRGHQD